MGLAFLMDVGSNFCTIKLRHVIPMPIYLVAPSISLIAPILIRTLLSVGVKVYEDAALLKRQWQNVVWKQRNMKYMKRKLWTIRVVRMFGEILQFNIFELKRSTKSAYYEAILSYTITTCLSV
ncbi:hypothetical protein Fcan01_00074 [Folsomia candida]|uniref:Uncharacterized protein n=1 Tax=Folsomia candida TaxID=158441 RepID=A0A226F1F8_FOLCA|nr:hypothetical protein Fcan01_00074 [Folsomia candida]